MEGGGRHQIFRNLSKFKPLCAINLQINKNPFNPPTQSVSKISSTEKWKKAELVSHGCVDQDTTTSHAHSGRDRGVMGGGMAVAHAPLAVCITFRGWTRVEKPTPTGLGSAAAAGGQKGEIRKAGAT